MTSSKILGNDENYLNGKLVLFHVIQRLAEKANELLPDFEGYLWLIQWTQLNMLH